LDCLLILTFFFRPRVAVILKFKYFIVELVILNFDNIELQFQFLFMLGEILNGILNISNLRLKYLFKFLYFLALLQLLLNFV